MARPLVRIDELLDVGGMSMSELIGFLEDADVDISQELFPVPLAWPMGFSWSSFISQSTMLGICNQAGLSDDTVLSDDAPTPGNARILHGVATDDIMIMSASGPGATSDYAARVDAAMKAEGMVGHEQKSVDDACDAVCIGVALEEGVRWAAPPGRCLGMLLMVLCLVSRSFASPLQVHQCLGTLQWYDLLVRPKLSVYHYVYKFTRDSKCSGLRKLPARVASELLMSVVLGIFWISDMRRPLLPLVCCSDASTVHGFGGSVLRTNDAVVQRLARLACKRDVFVAFGGPEVQSKYTRRSGHLEAVNINKEDFAHIFSIRKRRDDHINALEGEAMLILLRWVLRSVHRHSSRVVIMLDSSVILGGAAKGRSSTRLNRIFRRAAALELAGDVQVYWVLVPSAENPSDLPSRGRWHRA